MAHPALLTDRPRSERGLTLTVLHDWLPTSA